MGSIYVCNQDGCGRPAAYRYTWPGHDEAGICEGHVRALTNVAAALGCHLQVIPIPPADASGGPGHLLVGTDGAGQVVINLDHDRTGHIVFSPAQARSLAELMARKADEADAESTPATTASIGTDVRPQPQTR
jgi:hypothetical protein